MTHRRPAALALVIVLALVGGVVLLASAGGLGRLLSLRPAARGPASEAEAPGGEPRATSGDQSARQLPSGAATVAPAGTPAATFGAAGSPTLPATVTLTPQPPRPSGTPLPFRIVGPLAIDGPRRRLYAPVEVHGEGRIGVFSAEDGSRLGVLYLNGAVAVDAERGRLLVDDPATGLHVLDAETREEVKLIQLPLLATQSAVGEQQPTALPPAASPRVQPAVVEPSGQVAIARWGTVWMVDVEVASAHAVSLPSVYYERGVTIKELKSAGPGEPLWILDGSGGAAWGQNISVHRSVHDRT